MTALTIFNQHIRTINNLFSLNDLYKASGSSRTKQPANFIRLDSTQELISEIKRSRNSSLVKSDQSSDLRIALKTNHGGANPGTWVCKELVYAYAMWVSAKFHLQVIRAFDQLVSQPIQPQLPAYHPIDNLDMHHQRFLIEVENGEIVRRQLLDSDEMIMNRYRYVNYFKEPDVGFSDIEQLSELSRLVNERLCKQVSSRG